MQAFHGRATGGLSIGEESFAFIERYVAYLVAYDLARVDFDAFNRVWTEAGLVGVVLAPLTDRGRALVDHVASLDQAIPGESAAVRERPIQMLFDELPERAARIDAVKRLQ